MNEKRPQTLIGVLALMFAASGLGATTAHADNIDLLDTLHHNHVITDTQYQQLKTQAEKQQEEKTAPAQAAQKPDRAWLPRIGGYAQFDFPLTVSNADSIGSRTDLRRLFLQFKGDLGRDWHYYGSFGYYNGDTYLSRATLSYTGLHWATITAGQSKVPYSLAHLTSARNLALPEWPLPVMVLLPSKRIGLWLSSHGSRWSLAGGLFGGDFDQKPQIGVEGRWGASLRATLVSWRTPDAFWAVGGSFAWSEADSNHLAHFAYRPETFVVGAKLVDANLTGVDWFTTSDVETQFQWRSLRLQGEYLWTHVTRRNASHLLFTGWYVQTSWIVTGERRKLSSRATPGGVTPRHALSDGGWGAWELASRYSVVDLNNADVSAGRERTASIGVNWYPEKPIKLTLAGIRVSPMQGGAFAGKDSNIVMARIQFSY